MNVVDSSGWIEYLKGGPNASFFAPPIEAVKDLLVASISILEVYRHILRHQGREAGLRVVAAMQQGRVVELNQNLALLAAELGVALGLPLADSVILATARHHRATLWTQDADFKGIEGVKFRRKRP